MFDLIFLHRAIELAKIHSADGQNGPFGAVIVRANSIIAEGWNQVVDNNDPTAHAEVVAIRNACQRLRSFRLDGCTIYSSCEPCPMCLSAIYWSRIDSVVFAASQKDAAKAGFDDAFLYDEMGRSWAKRKINSFRGLEKEGIAVFELWEKNPDKIAY